VIEPRLVLILASFVALAPIRYFFPPGDPVDACDDEVVLHELGRMYDVESAMFDLIETETEMDRLYSVCLNEHGREQALRANAEARLAEAAPMMLLADEHLAIDYAREQRILGALEERDRQQERAERMEGLHMQCQERLWEASRTRLTQDHIDRDLERDVAFRQTIRALERCRNEH
jgi:hypothetical protein